MAVVAVAHEGQLAALQVAQKLLHGEGVGQHLGGMVALAAGVDDWNGGDVGHLAHVGLLALGAQHDGVVHLAEHADGVLHRLLVAEVRVGQVGEAQAQVMAGGLEGAAGAGRLPLEVGHHVLVVEAGVIDAGHLLGLQHLGQIQQVLELVGGHVADVDDVLSYEVVKHG